MSSSKENKSANSVVASPAASTFFRPVILPKLSINQPNDIYEQEADATADKVMRMPDPSADNNLFFKPSISPVQRKCAHCEEEEKQTQRKESDSNETVAPEQAETYINSLNGKGRSLGPDERNFFEPRFGYDFSNVQLHTGSEANQSAKSIDALAYTHGNNIVFGSGQYQPDTDGGKKLMAHELTHVVQQSGSAGSYNSPSLAMRSRLRRKTNSIQLAPQNTHWGTFKDESYSTLKDGTGKGIGVEMYLKFQPGNNVDAKMIGMVQSVRSVINGVAVAIGGDPTIKSRMISVADARPNNSPVLGNDSGIQIDQAPTNRNPLYAVEGAPAADTTLSQGPTPAPVTALKAAGAQGQLYSGWGVHGYRYKDGANWKSKDAELHDTPMIGARGNNAEQLFETTALAVDGTQNGTYYGSVEWGWRTDAAGKFTPIPFALKSMGIPSSSFLKAASIWNTGKTSAGTANLKLPLPVFQIYVVTNPLAANMNDTAAGVNVLLPVSTRVRIIRTLALHVEAEVIDGPMIGRRGLMDASDLGEERNIAVHPSLPPAGDFEPMKMPQGTAIG